MLPLSPYIQHLERHGHQLALEIWPNPGAGCMLFYPGTMLSPRQYRPLMEAFHQSGLAVAGLHLEGHGINPHCSTFTFDSLLEDGLYAERWLIESGYGPVAVCGHSQGGILAVAHAGISTTLTAAFAICSILPQMPQAIQLTRFAPYASLRNRLERAISSLARIFPRLPVPVAAYLSLHRLSAGHGRICIDRRHSRATYPLSFLDSLFRACIAPNISCPFRLYNALNDALFTPRLALAFYNELAAPEKSLVWLAKGGHLAPMAPAYAAFIARDAAAMCAGKGMPLSLATAATTVS